MCTGIKLDYIDGCVLGRTMDFECKIDYNLLYLPRNYNYCDDLCGNEIITKYKTMGTCFGNKDPLKDGINEHGLIGITNDFLGFNLYSKELKEDKLNISSLDYMTYALSKYKSVEELIKDIENINISIKNFKGEKVLSPDFHFCFTDSTKKCVVIEPKNGKLEVFNNPYNVMTNSPSFNSHIKKLEKLMDINNLDNFNSAKNLPGGYDPSSRFIKAFYLTNTNIKPKDSKEALSHIYNILGTVSMPKGFIKNKKYDDITSTLYTCAYDTKEKLLTIKTDYNPTVYELSFKDIKEENSRCEFFLNNKFTTTKL